MNERDHSVLEDWKKQHPKWFNSVRVLEIGSCNINGTARDHFKAKEYIGVDWHKGNDVDVICYGHQTKFKRDQFDVLISFSALEHDCYFPETITHNLQWLKKGGIIMLAWAGMGSNPHSLEHATDNKEFKPVPSASQEYQELKKEGHYYPKTLQEVREPLERSGCKIIEASEEYRRSISGLSCRLLAKKL